jgi:hypothetical protein
MRTPGASSESANDALMGLRNACGHRNVSAVSVRLMSAVDHLCSFEPIRIVEDEKRVAVLLLTEGLRFDRSVGKMITFIRDRI